MKISYLSDLVPGETAFINNIDGGELCRRLYDLGFVCGTKVDCIAKAPFGGPGAYLVRGAVIALRCADARTVNVQRIPAQSGRYGKGVWV